MPMWTIHAPAGAFDTAQKKDLTETITQFYVDAVQIPRFYVVVAFHEHPTDTLWVGGEPKNNFVRFVIDHIARQLDTPELREWCMSTVEEYLAPHIKDRGFDWEIHIDETPLNMWRVQGLTPPPPWSEAEKQWALDNAPTPYQLADATS